MTVPSYRILGLDPAPFAPLFDLDDAALLRLGARRTRADEAPGYPCRVALEDAAVGEELILVNHTHQPAATPYGSRGPIFVGRAGLGQGRRAIEGAVPAVLARRLLSVRGYDADGLMLDADVVEGHALEPLIARLFADPAIVDLHVHFAKRGCYAARIERA
jgi:hypothetical protein